MIIREGAIKQVERIELTNRIRIIDASGNDVAEYDYEDPTAVAIECWYDRHYRHWVIYPVDADGNQLEEARYGFGKKEAMAIKEEMEERLIGQQIWNAYVQHKKEGK